MTKTWIWLWTYVLYCSANSAGMNLNNMLIMNLHCPLAVYLMCTVVMSDSGPGGLQLYRDLFSVPAHHNQLMWVESGVSKDIEHKTVQCSGPWGQKSEILDLTQSRMRVGWCLSDLCLNHCLLFGWGLCGKKQSQTLVIRCLQFITPSHSTTLYGTNGVCVWIRGLNGVGVLLGTSWE